MKEENFELTILEESNCPKIILSGNVASIQVKTLQRHLEKFFMGNNNVIYLDISSVIFLDSHGLGTIVYYHTLLHKKKRKLILINNSDKNSYLSRLFENTNLDKVLNIIQTN